MTALPSPDTRSDLERDFLDFCLVVELDSFEFHGTRAAFERDRARDTALQLAGYRVLRITWRRLRNEPHAIAAAIRTLLTASAA